MKDVSPEDLQKRLPLVARQSPNQRTEVVVESFGDATAHFGGKHLSIIAGPCAIEGKEQIQEIAERVKDIGANMLRGGAFKPLTFPYPAQFNYPDLEAQPEIAEEKLKLLADAGKMHSLPVVTEVLHVRNVPLVAKYANMLQIGARNMQNIELLTAVGKMKNPVLLKRHPGMGLRDFLGAAEWIAAYGNRNIVLCERGISAPHTHSPNSRFLPDIAAIAYLKKFSHLPVIFDPSHSTFNRDVVAPMARAAVAAGADGILIDVHPTPEKAAIDPLQALNYHDFRQLVDELRAIANALGRS